MDERTQRRKKQHQEESTFERNALVLIEKFNKSYLTNEVEHPRREVTGLVYSIGNYRPICRTNMIPGIPPRIKGKEECEKGGQQVMREESKYPADTSHVNAISKLRIRAQSTTGQG